MGGGGDGELLKSMLVVKTVPKDHGGGDGEDGENCQGIYI